MKEKQSFSSDIICNKSCLSKRRKMDPWAYVSTEHYIILGGKEKVDHMEEPLGRFEMIQDRVYGKGTVTAIWISHYVSTWWIFKRF